MDLYCCTQIEPFLKKCTNFSLYAKWNLTAGSTLRTTNVQDFLLKAFLFSQKSIQDAYAMYLKVVPLCVHEVYDAPWFHLAYTRRTRFACMGMDHTAIHINSIPFICRWCGRSFRVSMVSIWFRLDWMIYFSIRQFWLNITYDVHTVYNNYALLSLLYSSHIGDFNFNCWFRGR